jgi:hypothetical protein
MILRLLLALMAGLLAWPLLEYFVHGLLSHRWRTFASPMHWGHHVDPHAVFTSPIAWVPSAILLWGLAALAVGPEISAGFVAGVVAGFLRYEVAHWRIHFREPRTDHERLMRRHHLAHHFCDPASYHGVTTRFWDIVFRTLPEEHAQHYAAVADSPLLTGASNVPRPLGVLFRA